MCIGALERQSAALDNHKAFRQDNRILPTSWPNLTLIHSIHPSTQPEGRNRADAYRSLNDTFDLSSIERPRAESTTSIATVDGDEQADGRGFG